MKKKVKVIMVETELGTFKKEGDGILFLRNDTGTDYNNKLKMVPECWRDLVTLMDEVLEVLEAADTE